MLTRIQETVQPVYFLLVDHLMQNLLVLESMLQHEGLHMLKARSGLQALELLLKHDVALALIDVQMPDMSGFELAELMRGTERTRRVPIIFLTAGNTDQRRFRGYEAGAVDFLSKPVETDVLKSKASVFFDLHRQRQEVARQRDELALMIGENTRLLTESRQYAHALQEADRRKDEFLATLAHELRNPLAPILHSVQILKLAGSAGPTEQKVFRIIERQVNHMVRLVDDLLEVSRITSGKIRLQNDLVELAEVVNNAVETSRPLLEAGRHNFSVVLPEAPLQVEGDLVRLTQMLANLLNNAAKYTPESGTITLTVARDQGQAVLSVRDNGLGIPSHMLGSVFEMFTQINRHLKRAQGGLGIGLTLVKRLVELHGGTIAVTSAGEGQGAEFTVHLPLVDVSERTDNEPPVQRNPQQCERILMLKNADEPPGRLAGMLEAWGHDVVNVRNSDECMLAITSFQPTIVILDLDKYNREGCVAASTLRTSWPDRDILVVALTSWGEEQWHKHAGSADFDFQLIKPVDALALQGLLNARRARDIRAGRDVSGQPV